MIDSSFFRGEASYRELFYDALSDSQILSKRVFVMGLGPSVTEEKLHGIFAQVGPLLDCFFYMTNFEVKYVFISFGSVLEARTAVNYFHGRMIDGRRLVVRSAEVKPRFKQTRRVKGKYVKYQYEQGQVDEDKEDRPSFANLEDFHLNDHRFGAIEEIDKKWNVEGTGQQENNKEEKFRRMMMGQGCLNCEEKLLEEDRGLKRGDTKVTC